MKNRLYSNAQSNYMLATANYQVALEELRKLQILHGIDEMYDVDFDKAFDLDETFSEQVGSQLAYDLKSQAESALVEWGFGLAQMEEKYKANMKDLEFLRQQAKENLVTREKCANLIMKLVPVEMVTA